MLTAHNRVVYTFFLNLVVVILTDTSKRQAGRTFYPHVWIDLDLSYISPVMECQHPLALSGVFVNYFGLPVGNAGKWNPSRSRSVADG